MIARLAVVAGLAVILLSVAAEAHQRSLSFSSWEIRGRDAEIRLRVTELDLSAVPPRASAGPDSDFLGSYVSARLELFAAGAPCAVSAPPERRRIEAGQISFLWGVHCPATGGLRIRTRLFEESSSTHLHFVRFRREGGAIEERVLSEGEREWALDEPAGTSVGGYVVVGIEHILGGFDHLAFVSALLLVASSLGNVARVVTGFTLAHSLTLSLAATGAVRPDAAPIEALIGLSIALVAVENLWLEGTRHAVVPTVAVICLVGTAAAAAAGVGAVPGATLLGFALFTACYFALLGRSRRPEALRGAVAFLFGLLHGFGFAAVLAEAGLPPGRLARALLGFNVGVELGQLAVVAVLWIGLAWLSEERRSLVADLGSASVLALGTFWFVTRAFG